MARINFDDSLESHEPFWRLLERNAGDRDRTYGMLIRFFRLAQWHYGHDQPIQARELEEIGLAIMIETGWAVAEDGGYQVLGAAKHFDWYRHKVRGGQARAAAKRDANGQFVQQETSEMPAIAPALYHPPALAPSPALSKRQRHTSAEASDNPLLGIWNQNRGTLPEAKSYSTGRLKHARARWRDKPDPDYWTQVARKLASSSFCRGEDGGSWVATFDFFLKPETHLKALEGTYDRKGKGALRINTTPIDLESM